MELQAYLDTVRRQKAIILTVFVSTLLIAAGVSLLMTPVYKATTRMRLATARGGGLSYIDFDVEYADRLMNTYAELATTGVLQQELAAQLDLQKLPDVTVEAVPNTELMLVTARANDAQQAAHIANAMADLLVRASVAADADGEQAISDVLSAQIAEVEQRLLDLRRQSQTLAADAPEQAALTREIDVSQETYSDLLREYELARIRGRLQTSKLNVVDPALPPEQAARPNWMLNLALGALLGALGGVALAFVYDALDTSVSSSQQISEMVQLATLAEIPPIDENIDHTMIGNPQVEAFRRLYSNLYASREGQAPRSILITSAEGREGKTTVLVNLALALANAGKRVLVIDANLRAPKAAETLGVHSDWGLSDVIMREVSLSQVLKPAMASNIFVLGAGAISSTRFLYLPETKALLEQLQEKFDVVLIDTPAVLHYSDALALMPHVDGVLLVVDRHRSRRETIEAVRQQLRNMNVQPLGIVVNETSGAAPRHRLRQELLAY